MKESREYRAAMAVVERLRAEGSAAYFAGGCVRDMLLGVMPKDFDVATDAEPDAVQRLFRKTEAVGAHFGVVLVVQGVQGRENREQGTGDAPAAVTEVATFRHDGAYSDGRRPDAVRFSRSAEEDVRRRDFTINGLLLDAARYEGGATLEDCVLDFVGGRADLAAGVVRAIGEPRLRFTEDKLRMLRAVRFAARLGFAIEPATMGAMQDLAGEIGVVSVERTRDELTKILTEGGARRGLELLDEAGLLAVLLPEVKRMQGVEQPPEFHPEGDVWVHTLMVMERGTGNREQGTGLKQGQTQIPFGNDKGLGYGEHREEADPPATRKDDKVSATLAWGRKDDKVSATLAWGMLLHDVGKPATFTAPDPARAGDRIRFNGHVDVGVAVARGVLSRLRFSNEDCEQILALVKHHMQFGDVKKMKQSTLKRFLRLPKFEEHLALHYADCMSAHGKLGMWEFARAEYARLGEEEIRPKLLVTGKDLIAAGYKPGPRFKAMLEAVEDAQLEGLVGTTEEGLRWIAKW